MHRMTSSLNRINRSNSRLAPGDAWYWTRL